MDITANVKILSLASDNAVSLEVVMKSALNILICFLAISCNRSQQNSDEKISNGVVISGDDLKKWDPGSYTVAVTTQSGNCTGVLIHSRIVLTAAHCKVKSGDIIERFDSSRQLITKTVIQAITNETYTMTEKISELKGLNLASDFALALLDSEYLNVRDILPRAESRTGARLFISGYGLNEKNIIDGKLRTVPLCPPVLNLIPCVEAEMATFQ